MQINEWNFHGMVIKIQALELETAQQASRVARVYTWDGDILGNNGAGTDNYLVTDCDRKNGGIRSDTYPVTKFCWPPKLRLSSRPTGEK
jgi:hypothetical protein